MQLNKMSFTFAVLINQFLDLSTPGIKNLSDLRVRIGGEIAGRFPLPPERAVGFEVLSGAEVDAVLPEILGGGRDPLAEDFLLQLCDVVTDVGHEQ